MNRVLLDLSPAAYDEIKRKVIAADQQDRFLGGGAIDMFEIAVCLERVTIPPMLGTDPDIIEVPEGVNPEAMLYPGDD